MFSVGRNSRRLGYRRYRHRFGGGFSCFLAIRPGVGRQGTIPESTSSRVVGGPNELDDAGKIGNFQAESASRSNGSGRSRKNGSAF